MFQVYPPLLEGYFASSWHDLKGQLQEPLTNTFLIDADTRSYLTSLYGGQLPRLDSCRFVDGYFGGGIIEMISTKEWSSIEGPVRNVQYSLEGVALSKIGWPRAPLNISRVQTFAPGSPLPMCTFSPPCGYLEPNHNLLAYIEHTPNRRKYDMSSPSFSPEHADIKDGVVYFAIVAKKGIWGKALPAIESMFRSFGLHTQEVDSADVDAVDMNLRNWCIDIPEGALINICKVDVETPWLGMTCAALLYASIWLELTFKNRVVLELMIANIEERPNYVKWLTHCRESRVIGLQSKVQ